MLDDMNMDVDIIKRRSDIKNQQLDYVKNKIKRLINFLVGDDELSANQASIILSSGFGNSQYNSIAISFLQERKSKLKIKSDIIASKILDDENNLVQPTTIHGSQSKYFEELKAYEYYSKKIEDQNKELEKINSKIEMIDEVLTYIK